MPALIIPPGFAQATIPLTFTSVGREGVVTFGIDMAAFAGTDAAAADAVQVAWNTWMNPSLDSGVLAGPTSLIVGQDGTENTTAEGSVTASGTRSMISPPPQVAVLITKRSARGGRRGRGRLFVPFFVSQAEISEGGIIAGAAVTILQTAANNFRAELATDLVPMTILHTEEDPDPDVNSSPPGLPNTVTSLTVESLVSTQRRRLGR